jgi:hypothetical protein
MISLELSGQLPLAAEAAAQAYDEALAFAAIPFLPHTRPAAEGTG